MNRRFVSLSLVAASALLLQAQAVSAQTLKVLTAGAFKPALVELTQELEAGAGARLEVQNDTAGALTRRIQSGEAFDLIVLPVPALNRLATDKKVLADSVKPVAKVGIGIAARAGSTIQAPQTVEQFKQLLSKASKVAYIDPAAGGSSGIYLDSLFKRLGIADAVRQKAILVPGGLSGERVARGEAEIAIQQLSELLTVPGIKVIGGLPEEIQNYTVYGVAVSANSPSKSAAAALVKSLSSPRAIEVIRAKGMQPAQR